MSLSPDACNHGNHCNHGNPVSKFIAKVIASVEEDEVEIGYGDVCGTTSIECEFAEVLTYFAEEEQEELMREVYIQKGNMYEVVVCKLVPMLALE